MSVLRVCEISHFKNSLRHHVNRTTDCGHYGEQSLPIVDYYRRVLTTRNDLPVMAAGFKQLVSLPLDAKELLSKVERVSRFGLLLGSEPKRARPLFIWPHSGLHPFTSFRDTDLMNG